jgi:hypothetical protein
MTCIPADRDVIGSDTICVIGVSGLLLGVIRSCGGQCKGQQACGGPELAFGQANPASHWHEKTTWDGANGLRSERLCAP